MYGMVQFISFNKRGHFNKYIINEYSLKQKNNKNNSWLNIEFHFLNCVSTLNLIVKIIIFVYFTQFGKLNFKV